MGAAHLKFVRASLALVFFSVALQGHATDLGKKPEPSCAVTKTAELLEVSDLVSKALHGAPDIPTMARIGVQLMADQRGMAVSEKARIWREVVSQINNKSKVLFGSYEGQGRDGSVIFVGGDASVTLVIAPNGDIFRGKLPWEKRVRLDRRWEVDYSLLRRVEPRVP